MGKHGTCHFTFGVDFVKSFIGGLIILIGIVGEAFAGSSINRGHDFGYGAVGKAFFQWLGRLSSNFIGTFGLVPGSVIELAALIRYPEGGQ